jgi:ATP-dependent RNA helicase RhlE
MLKSPVLIEVARRNQVSETITHRVHPVSEYGKRGLLTKLLKSGEIRQCLVFMRTKQGCSRLTRELQRAGINADAIHGDKSQLERIKALEAFKGGTTARPDRHRRRRPRPRHRRPALRHQLRTAAHAGRLRAPHRPHRPRRQEGNAISLVSAREVGYLVDIEKLIKRPIEQVEVAGFEPEPEYEYPPGNKRGAARRRSRRPVAQRPERPERSTPPGAQRTSPGAPARAATR